MANKGLRLILAGCALGICVPSACKWMRSTPVAGPFPGLTAYRSEKAAPDRISTKRVLSVSATGETSELIEEPESKEKSAVRMVHARGVTMRIFHHLRLFYSVPANLSKPENAMRLLGDPKSDCAKTMGGDDNEKAGVRIGEETILGFRTIQYQKKLGDTDRTTWLAVDLGCFEIQSQFTWGPGPTGVRSTTLQTTDRVVVGAPSSDLFEVPQGFRRVKPSEAHQAVVAARLRAHGVPEDEVQEQIAAVLNDPALIAHDARAIQ